MDFSPTIGWLNQNISLFAPDDRELASLFVACAILAVALVRNAQTLSSSILEVLEAVLKLPIILVFLLLALSSAVIVRIASAVTLPFTGMQLWSPSMMKTTLEEVLCVGFPGLFSAVGSHSDKELFTKVVKPQFGIAAFLVFYIGISIQPLWLEIILQLLATLGVLMPISLRKSADYKEGGMKLSKRLLIFVGAIYIYLSTLDIVTSVDAIDWGCELRSLLFSLWYPFLLLVLLYPLAHYAALEKLNKRLKVINHVSLSKRIIVTVMLGKNLRQVACFSGKWNYQLEGIESAKDVVYLVRRYKDDLAARVRVERQRAIFVKDNVGKYEFDSNGIWLDRTKSLDVKRALEDLAIFQTAAYRKSGTYRVIDDELFSIYLPEGCSGQSVVSSNRKSWVGMMRTPSGFYYGIGKTNGQWESKFYEGASSLSPKAARRMQNFATERSDCKNWTFNDRIDESLVA